MTATAASGQSSDDTLVLSVGRIGAGYLTSAAWLDVLRESASRLSTASRASTFVLDLAEVRWFDHLSLLALCFVVTSCKRHFFSRYVVVLPANDQRRAFLERWGFCDLLRKNGFELTNAEIQHPYAESYQSRVFPVLQFQAGKDVTALRDTLLERTNADLQRVLQSEAYLDDDDVAGLAHLVVYELCSNAVDHSQSPDGGFIVGHVKKSEEEGTERKARGAGLWEQGMLAKLGREGMMEIVVGDSGRGIVGSLKSAASGAGHMTARSVLTYAFDAFSTSKRDQSAHTRGLWCVLQKIRDLRGVLYVRSFVSPDDFGSDGDPSKQSPPLSEHGYGVSAYWDFLNHPENQTPTFITDECSFPGTQFQILIPQRSELRPKTFVALFTGAASPVPRPQIGVSSVPIPTVAPTQSGTVLGGPELNGSDRLVFLDMSSMEASCWGRLDVDRLCKDIHDLLIQRRRTGVWLVNPPQDLKPHITNCSWFVNLWRNNGVVVPMTTIGKENRPPIADFAFADAALRSGQKGDTYAARMRLVEMLGLSVSSGDVINKAQAFEGLTADERLWVDVALSQNFSCICATPHQGSTVYVPIIDVYSLAVEAGLSVLRTQLTDAIKTRVDQRAIADGHAWYRLPSRLYSEVYVDDHMLHEADSWLRYRLDLWVERQLKALAPDLVLSYTAMGKDLLTQCHRSYPAAILRHLGDYLDVHSQGVTTALLPPKLIEGRKVVFLTDITGTGRTIAKLGKAVSDMGGEYFVRSLIDTISDDDIEREPYLQGLYDTDRLHAAAAFPFHKQMARPVKGTKARYPEIIVDPRTLQPIPRVHDKPPIMIDGVFWGMLSRTAALSTVPITYQGHDFRNFVWLKNCFQDSAVIKMIVETIRPSKGAGGCDYLIVPKQTSEWLSGTELYQGLRKAFRGKLSVGGEGDVTTDTHYEGRAVAVFLAASTTGTAVAELISRYTYAKSLSIYVFLNRMPNDIVSGLCSRPGITLVSFCRVFSGSPGLQHRSYRTAALRQLREYRKSVLSNRLVVFVDNEIERLRQTHTFVDSPDDFAVSSDMLAHRADQHLFKPDSSYGLETPEGLAAIIDLVQRCHVIDADWLRAVLHEAVCRQEALGSGHLQPEYFLPLVEDIYVATTAAVAAMHMRAAVLSVMILEPYVGVDTAHYSQAGRFAAMIWDDMQHATGSEHADFLAAGLGAIAKIHPSFFLDRLSDIVAIAGTSVLTDLTLSLILTRFLDTSTAPAAQKALWTAWQFHAAAREERSQAFKKAFLDILGDLGLTLGPTSIIAAKWDDIRQELAQQPRHWLRVVRAVVRSLMAECPGAVVHYLHRIEGDRYLAVESSTSPRAGTGSVPIAARVLAPLLDSRTHFFSRDVRTATEPLVHRFSEEIQPFLESRQVDAASLLLLAVREAAPGAVAGPLVGMFRIVTPFIESTGGMADDQVTACSTIVKEAADVSLQLDPNPLGSVGVPQFLAAWESLAIYSEPSALLPILSNTMLLLLNGNLARVASHDFQRHVWRTEYTSGDWSGSAVNVKIPDWDQGYATVRVAASRHPELIHDVNCAPADHPAHPPNNWVHGCVALPLVVSGRVSTVITVWHRVPGWFSHHPSSLLLSLCKAGSSALELSQLVERGTQMPAAGFAHTIRNQLNSVAQTLKASAVTEQERKECAEQVVAVLANVQKFLDLSNIGEFLPDDSVTPAQLYHFIGNWIHAECRRQGTVLASFETCCTAIGFVDINSDALKADIQEFIVNTVRHGGPGRKVTLRLRESTAADVAVSEPLARRGTANTYVAIEYVDDGPGVPLTLRKDIFEWRGLQPGRAHWGLPLAREHARKLGGDVVYVGGTGATFVVLLPMRTQGV